MNEYQLGKDIGALMQKVEQLEQRPTAASASPCNCPKTSTPAENIPDQAIFDSLADAAPTQEVFLILKCLIQEAGDITIKQLFSYSSDQVGCNAAEAISAAKKIGFLALSNDKCCHEVDDPFKNDFCKTQKGKWCSLVRTQTKMRCTLASDKC